MNQQPQIDATFTDAEAATIRIALLRHGLDNQHMALKIGQLDPLVPEPEWITAMRTEGALACKLAEHPLFKR